jgi:hypothetical protein
MQQRTARVLKEHELDLVRSFRTRLLDVQRELHMERSRQDEAALEWIERAQVRTRLLSVLCVLCVGVVIVFVGPLLLTRDVGLTDAHQEA